MLSREVMVKTFYERFCRPTLKRLEDPAAAQEACLRKILNRCKNTVFGKEHSFSDIKSIEDFQHKVPIATHESMQPFIARCKTGEQNVLFPDKIVYFLVTAGTTGTSKLYPLGEHRVRELYLDGVMGSVFYIVHTENYDVMDGAILTLNAPPSTGQRVGQYDAAYLSGALPNVPLPPQLQMLRAFRAREELRRVPPREVDKVLDWDKKFYLTARYAVATDVRSSIGITSNIVSLLRKISTQYLDRLLADPELDNETKTKLRRLTNDGDVNLQELWPNFQVFVSGGMSLTPYRRIIHDLLGDVDIWEQYGTTEVSVGLQIFDDKGIIPMVDRTFFEFIPSEEEDAVPIPLSDVKLHTPYRILVTSNGGFYRFDIGDLVTFTDLNPPVFGEISRRKALVNVAGERTSEEMILQGLEKACEQHGIGFVDFALLPEVTADVIRYHLFIEFTQTPEDLEEFASVVDTHLRRVNLYYKSQRQNSVLSLPVIISVRPGGFEDLLQQLEKIPGQGKVPRLLTPKLSRMIPLE